MRICIIGTGAAGWMTAHLLREREDIDHVTIIGSPHIPTIGVGESTTATFPRFLHTLNRSGYDMFKLLVDIDAAAKYGVYYEGWSEESFLHAFVGGKHNNDGGYLLGNLSKKENVNHYMIPLYDEIINKNSFNFDSRAQNYSFHFDANKFISSIENFSKNLKDITHIKDTVTGCNKNKHNKEKIESLILENSGEFKADYYINCVGQTSFNENIFGESYHDYSDVLLTDTAIFCPLLYKDKRREFHPYTIARAMKYGWRWITPTWSRIGTGYAFSSKYISIEEAKKELCNDIGDDTIELFVTSFQPKRVNKVFKDNYCTIGMAAGFLEPLDAPGLTLSIHLVDFLNYLFEGSITNEYANTLAKEDFDRWASFILHQYKTSTRSDTQFWRDHRNVKFDCYDKITEYLFENYNNNSYEGIEVEPWMFYHTSAGKGHRWKVKGYSFKDKILRKNKPKKQSITKEELPKELKEYMFNHFYFFNEIHKKYD